MQSCAKKCGTPWTWHGLNRSELGEIGVVLEKFSQFLSGVLSLLFGDFGGVCSFVCGFGALWLPL